MQLLSLLGYLIKKKDNLYLLLWSVFYSSVVCFRIVLSVLYQFDKQPEHRLALWRNLYIIGALLGGISWGLASLLLLPHATPIQQTLLVLMLAGVTAGAVPLLAAIPSAAIAFLSCSLLPFIAGILLESNNIYHLFDIALTLYFIYSIVLTLKTYKLIETAVIVQFENDLLLADLALKNIKLEEAATHDPLTKIANRRLFLLQLENVIKRAHKNNTLFSVLFIDLDHFKQVNDTYGHQVGDVMLQTVIARLKTYFKTDNNMARLGGDELAVIVDGFKEINELEHVGQAICDLMREPFKINNEAIKISVSIGISVYPYDGQTESTLMRSADECMYRVKRRGGNHFQLSERTKVY